MSATKMFRVLAAGSVSPDSAQGSATSFGMGVGWSGGVWLVVRRLEDRSVVSVVADSGTLSDADRLALAHASGSRLEPFDGPNLIADGRVRGFLRTPWWPTQVQKSTQQGVALGETARLVGDAIAPGCWVAMSLRKLIGLTEGDGWEKYATRRLGVTGGGTHHSREKGHVLASIMAGGNTRDEVRDSLTRVAAALPGFDVSCGVKFASRWPRPWVWLLGILATVLGLAAGMWTYAVDTVTGKPGLGVLTSFGVWAVAGLCALVAAVWMAGWWPGFLSRVATAKHVGDLPRPPVKWWPTRRPANVAPGDISQALMGTRSDRNKMGGYPLRRCNFVLGPMLVAGFVAPARGVESGVVTSALTKIPPEAAREGIGPVVMVSDGVVARLSAADLWTGLAISGRSGCGKTGILFLVWAAYLCAIVWARLTGHAIPGWPGEETTMVAFESKGGDGLDDWRRWGVLAGTDVDVVSLTLPLARTIDFLHVHPDPLECASQVAASMKFVFEAGAIQNLAMQTLTGVWSGAFVVENDAGVFARCPEEPARAAVELAAVLVGCAGADRARRLFSALAQEAAVADGVRGQRLKKATELLVPIFGTLANPSSSSVFTNQTGSSMSKINALLKATSWWARSRAASPLTWRGIVAGHRRVVVDISTGSGLDVLDEETQSTFASMLAYTLWQTIQQECGGWQRAGKHGYWLSDELSLTAPASPKMYPWFLNQGRSFGWEALAATQFLDQLDPLTRTSFLTAANAIAMTQSSPSVAEEVAREMGGGVTGEHICSLPFYTGVARISVGGARVPAFTATVPDWADDPVSIIRANGFEPALRDFSGRLSDVPVTPLKPAAVSAPDTAAAVGVSAAQAMPPADLVVVPVAPTEQSAITNGTEVPVLEVTIPFPQIVLPEAVPPAAPEPSDQPAVPQAPDPWERMSEAAVAPPSSVSASDDDLKLLGGDW